MTNLSSLKVGDKVIVFSGNSATVRTVEKIGKLHITAGVKFRLLDGYAVGENIWSSSRVEPFQQEVWDVIKLREAERKMRRRLDDFNTWRGMPIETIREVCALLDSKQPVTEEVALLPGRASG